MSRVHPPVVFIGFDKREIWINLVYIPLLGGCYGKSCKLNGQHTRARNHSAISRVVIALHKLLHRGPGLMIFITALKPSSQ